MSTTMSGEVMCSGRVAGIDPFLLGWLAGLNGRPIVQTPIDTVNRLRHERRPCQWKNRRQSPKQSKSTSTNWPVLAGGSVATGLIAQTPREFTAAIKAGTGGGKC